MGSVLREAVGLALGEQQRLGIARALLQAPDFLFLDEPEVDQASWDKAMVPEAAGWLDAEIAGLEEWDFEAPVLYERTMALAEELGASRKKFQAPVRVAVPWRARCAWPSARR